MIGTGAMSDPYMHCEGELRLTRKCLEIILQYGFGAAIQTKSDRILRDIELLEQALRSKRRRCVIGTGSMSDPYMHCEEQLRLTRRCLQIILQYGFGAAIQTKSDRILQDIDLLDEINRSAKCVVQMTLTTYDDDLCGILEPNVCNTKRRIEVLEEMQKRGIPAVVWLTPILPFINDSRENITSILNECVRVDVKGVIDFGMGLTLREGDRE